MECVLRGNVYQEQGAQVEWKTPATGTNATTCIVDLIVRDGPRVVSGTAPVRLHNSVAEVSGMALEFLNEFADSGLPADERMLRNFSDTPNECREGKAAELKDVQDNRKEYSHQFAQLRRPNHYHQLRRSVRISIAPLRCLSRHARGMEFHEN